MNIDIHNKAVGVSIPAAFVLTGNNMSNLQIEDWGVIDYDQAYARQRQLVDAVIAGAQGRLILCEHPAVLTLGRMTKPESILFSKEEIEQQGVMFRSIDRGGDVTLHAPGQLVVYVIMDLNTAGRDLKRFMQQLEQVAVDLLKEFGILAESIQGKRGVFIATEKIVSIGVGVRKWVTYHGLGINVNTDLALFRLIRPCGLDVGMTSMQKVLAKPINMDDVKQACVRIVERRFS